VRLLHGGDLTRRFFSAPLVGQSEARAKVEQIPPSFLVTTSYHVMRIMYQTLGFVLFLSMRNFFFPIHGVAVFFFGCLSFFHGLHGYYYSYYYPHPSIWRASRLEFRGRPVFVTFSSSSVYIANVVTSQVLLGIKRQTDG
jgi:hypothetical protein